MTERAARRAMRLSLLAALALLGPGEGRAAPTMDGPYIVNDLAAAQAVARRTGKPIFVVFRCEQ